MPTRPTHTSGPRPVILALATTLALGLVSGACKDPNPTFVFDASSDGAKDAVTDGTGSVDASAGTGGAGGGAGGGGGGGAAGAAGGGSGGAAGGAGAQAAGTSGSGGVGGAAGTGGAA